MPKCSVLRCRNNKYTKAGNGYFRFPQEKDKRLALWVKNVGDEDLLSLPPATLHKTRRICYLHFAQDDFTTDKKNNLKSTALPTIFDATVKQLSDESIKDLQKELASKIKKSAATMPVIPEQHHQTVPAAIDITLDDSDINITKENSHISTEPHVESLNNTVLTNENNFSFDLSLLPIHDADKESSNQGLICSTPKKLNTNPTSKVETFLPISIDSTLSQYLMNNEGFVNNSILENNEGMGLNDPNWDPWDVFVPFATSKIKVIDRNRRLLAIIEMCKIIDKYK